MTQEEILDAVLEADAATRRRILRALLYRRTLELSEPDAKPWPCIRFPSVPSGKAGMDVPVWAILETLAAREPGEG